MRLRCTAASTSQQIGSTIILLLYGKKKRGKACALFFSRLPTDRPSRVASYHRAFVRYITVKYPPILSILLFTGLMVPMCIPFRQLSRRQSKHTERELEVYLSCVSVFLQTTGKPRAKLATHMPLFAGRCHTKPPGNSGYRIQEQTATRIDWSLWWLRPPPRECTPLLA